jgi:hypothetical protein
MSVGWNGGVMMMARVDEFTSYHRRLWAREPVRVWGTHSVDPATNYPQKFQEYKPPFFYQNLNLFIKKTLTKDRTRDNKTFNHHPVGVRLEEISVRLKGDGPPLAARCEMKASPQHTNAQGISSDGLGPS